VAGTWHQSHPNGRHPRSTPKDEKPIPPQIDGDHHDADYDRERDLGMCGTWYRGWTAAGRPGRSWWWAMAKPARPTPVISAGSAAPESIEMS
jgi:hypothetical protein